MVSPGMFHRTIANVHWNPVKAGLVRAPAEYRWSSAKMWEDGLWDEEAGLRIQPQGCSLGKTKATGARTLRQKNTIIGVAITRPHMDT